LAVARDTSTGTGSGCPQGMPSLKAATGKERPPKGPRKCREQQFVWHRMEPTTQVAHAVEHYPTCGLTLTVGSVKRSQADAGSDEVPVAPAVMTEHVYVERCWPYCHTRHNPTVALEEAVMGKQRFGVGLASLIVTPVWRDRHRTPPNAKKSLVHLG